jgi:hypothetical protein
VRFVSFVTSWFNRIELRLPHSGCPVQGTRAPVTRRPKIV